MVVVAERLLCLCAIILFESAMVSSLHEKSQRGGGESVAGEKPFEGENEVKFSRSRRCYGSLLASGDCWRRFLRILKEFPSEHREKSSMDITVEPRIGSELVAANKQIKCFSDIQAGVVFNGDQMREEDQGR